MLKLLLLLAVTIQCVLAAMALHANVMTDAEAAWFAGTIVAGTGFFLMSLVTKE